MNHLANQIPCLDTDFTDYHEGAVGLDTDFTDYHEGSVGLDTDLFLGLAGLMEGPDGFVIPYLVSTTRHSFRTGLTPQMLEWKSSPQPSTPQNKSMKSVTNPRLIRVNP